MRSLSQPLNSIVARKQARTRQKRVGVPRNLGVCTLRSEFCVIFTCHEFFFGFLPPLPPTKHLKMKEPFSAHGLYKDQWWVYCITSVFWDMSMSIFYLVLSGLHSGMQTLSWGTWDVAPWPGIEPGPPALGAQSLNQWITREVPTLTSGQFLKLPSAPFPRV